MKLLIVNNDEHESWALSELASSVGYEVTVTWSGREALNHLQTGCFDFLWLDQYLADMYVGEFLELLCRVHDCPDILIIKTGGNDFRADPKVQTIEKEQLSRILRNLATNRQSPSIEN